ncbi:unnamed protein product [Prorocentrum cordatum]|uniref:Polycystin cation channel PKD1/PKD2 domain-containing protein n=1 Tax=Prorocentrum cordatum TaxID=2364126 RepID=A0ABN9PZL1_9DINO|nr:unnamed protein product [Polarella glacialis]
MKELVPACLNGFDGFIDYLGFWNVIDWLSMIMAIVVATLWLLFCFSVSGELQDSITQLPMTELNDQIIQNGTWFSPAEIEAVVPRAELEDHIEKVQVIMESLKNQHYLIRQVLFFYSFVLLMKFFKAFRANPRLNIVIQTITSAFIDLIHFFLVFSLIFCVFSGSAHIIFGANMKPFSDQWLSAMMCFRILMGEFDVDEMVVAGGPLAWVWFLAFQLLVFLILLNLLLAIIVDSYAAAKAKYVDPITIWSQVNKARKTMRETRGHLDLWYLICEFEDDEYPAHPQPKVTSKSLRKAFVRDKMTKGNADYCVRKSLEYLKEKEGELDLTITDAIREISKIGVQTLKIADQTEITLDMMREDRKRPQEARLKAIWDGSETNDVASPQVAQGQSAAFGHVLPLPSGSPSIMPLGASRGQLALPTRAGNSSHIGAFGHMPGTTEYATSSRNSRDIIPPSRGGGERQPFARSASGDQPAAGPPGGLQAAGELMAMMQHMQATMDAMRSELYATTGSVTQQLQEQRTFTERREEWLDNRLNQVERRCEKVEKASDRLHGVVNNWDFDEMTHSQRKILAHTTKLTDVQKNTTAARVRSPSRATAREPGASSPVSTPRSAPSAPMASSQALGSSQLSSELEERMKGINAQLERLLEHAEDATESRKLLWRIELNIKQLRGQA